MKRIIIDYKKLTPEILSLLSEKYPGGYGDSDIIQFKNLNNDSIEAVEVKTEEIIYLVKVSSKLHSTILNLDSEIDLDIEEVKGSKKSKFEKIEFNTDESE